MIYFYLKNINSDIFSGVLPIVYLINEGSPLGTADILKNPDLLNDLQIEGINLQLVWLPTMNAPVLTFDTANISNDSISNVSDIYDAVSKIRTEDFTLPADKKEGFINIITTRYDRQMATMCIAAALIQQKYESTKVTYAIKVPINFISNEEFFNITNQLLSKHNQLFSNPLANVENETLHQDTCEDKFFIEIPSRMQLLAEDDLNVNKFIPKRASICTPYNDVNAYSRDYKNKHVSKHLYPLIEGNPDNNSLGIQENEQDYFDALCNWVKLNIQEEYGKETNIIDTISKEYLLELLRHIYSWHWSHNKNVPINFVDEEDSDEASTSVSSRYEYEYVPGSTISFSNALLAIERYVDSAAAELGYVAYVEAIIKTARWGTRKGTALVLDNYAYVFDYGTNQIKQNIGSISDYETELVNGHQYDFNGFVTLSSPIADDKLSIKEINTPIGVILTRRMKNADNIVIAPLYVSMFDFISMINEEENAVNGISKTHEDFIVTQDKIEIIPIRALVNDYVNDSDSFLQNPFYRSKDFTELVLKFKTGKSAQDQNMMMVLDDALRNPNLVQEMHDFTLTKFEDLYEKMERGLIFSSSAALISNLTRIMLPVIEEVNSKCVVPLNDSSNASSIFKTWEYALKNWEGVNSIYVTTPKKSEGTDAIKNMATVKNMDSFNTNSAINQKEKYVTEECSTMSTKSSPNSTSISLLRAIKPNEKFKKLVNGSGTPVGAYALEEVPLPNGAKMRKFLFITIDTYNNLDASQQIDGISVPVLKIISNLIANLYAVAKNEQANVLAYFDSTDTIEYYVKIIHKALATIV